MYYFSLLPLALANFILKLSYASLLLPRQAPDYVFPGDAPYGVPTAELSSVLTCPKGNPTANSKPVLLVHGTASTGNESFGFGYVPALAAQGFTPCYIDLPNRALSDMQLSSSYIAYNLHAVSALASGNPVAVMGHSQANPDIQWALHFWPSTHTVTSMYIGLSPDLVGVGLSSTLMKDLCTLDTGGTVSLCQPSLWQQITKSNYYSALDRTLKSEVTTTEIWSMTDEVVVPPQPNAELPGGNPIAVQDLCPGRITDHVTMLIDPAGFALALDALNNGGTASLDRVKGAQTGLGVCGELVAANMDPTVPSIVNAAYGLVVKGLIQTVPRVSAEPPVMTYAMS